MNQINQTTLEQLNVRVTNEPCTIVQLARKILFSDADNSITLKVKGDKLNGSAVVHYNEGTDLYDISFYTSHGQPWGEEAIGMDFETMPGLIWNRFFVV